MRKPTEFESHSSSYADARASGRFRAFCKHVVDGDTFDVFVDLGLGKYAYDTIRLLGIDTPEINSGAPEQRVRGEEAKARTADLIYDKPILIQTFKDAETFGRYVADAFYLSSGLWISLAETLRTEGYAK